MIQAQAGDIIALVGLKNVQTGHTLCDPKSPGTLEPMVFPDPVISMAVEPIDQANAEKLAVAIGKMVKEDPSFHVETDRDSGETILKGMGELHLDIKVDILKRTHGVEVTVGAPQVAYRETITNGSKIPTLTRNRLVVPASTRSWTTSLNRLTIRRAKKTSSLNRKSSVETFPGNSGRPSRKASVFRWRKARWRHSR